MLPTSMHASWYTNYKGPEVLKIETLPVSEIRDDAVLIEVQYSTVNRTDSGFLTGKPWIVRLFSGVFRPRFKALGCEFAGRIGAFVWRQAGLFPLPHITHDDVVYFQGLLASGQFRPLIDRRYPLAVVQQAFSHVLTGMKVGNVFVVLPAA